MVAQVCDDSQHDGCLNDRGASSSRELLVRDQPRVLLSTYPGTVPGFPATLAWIWSYPASHSDYCLLPHLLPEGSSSYGSLNAVETSSVILVSHVPFVVRQDDAASECHICSGLNHHCSAAQQVHSRATMSPATISIHQRSKLYFSKPPTRLHVETLF